MRFSSLFVLESNRERTIVLRENFHGGVVCETDSFYPDFCDLSG